ncbi:MAG: hypothetical protein S4CHLAM45_11490 [Chlamydiales bacterium]|nr:hypothetical protein [Chlamydiales bacterium]MCH9619641.1 hypothetical protein [Chlamydiales bacterium]MCH9623247.1 hypothetical protein [Chlamydiales bacterium]
MKKHFLTACLTVLCCGATLFANESGNNQFFGSISQEDLQKSDSKEPTPTPPEFRVPPLNPKNTC